MTRCLSFVSRTLTFHKLYVLQTYCYTAKRKICNRPSQKYPFNRSYFINCLSEDNSALNKRGPIFSFVWPNLQKVGWNHFFSIWWRGRSFPSDADTELFGVARSYSVHAVNSKCKSPSQLRNLGPKNYHPPPFFPTAGRTQFSPKRQLNQKHLMSSATHWFI